ncbi:MFS transporter [Sphingomonas cavernae]|uniref:MFS transporter n=1 Tax=Sphingomonas cavernae TaxID=2320861 RepID=A0A418WLA4_9SPHN|nr:MFS transporter [Sphingomonas cavernae]RJF90831.1 MFS transporter [Sphingomonas cavernae]
MITRRQELSYAAGDVGFNLIWQSIELYLLFFYIETAGLPLAVAAGIFLLGAMVDWLADPVIGTLADRFAGRYPLRVWVLLSGPFAGVALALAFSVPPLAPGPLAIYAAATHVLLRFAYSCGNIPYAALTARMTDDPFAHARLTGVRMQGAAIGGLLAALVYALESAWSESGTHQFFMGALVLGMLAQPCFYMTWAGVREQIVTGRPQSPLSIAGEFRTYLTMVSRSAELRRVLATILAAGLSTTVTFKSILFLFDRDMQQGAWGYWAALLPSIALLTTAPVWVALSRRLGRARSLAIAAAIHCAALLLIAVMPARDMGSVTLLLAIAITASCGMSVMFWALVPAAIQDLEADPGSEPCAARAYALSTTTRKLGQALAPQLIALSLAVTRSDDAAKGGGSVIPALVAGAAVCLVMMLLYRPGRMRSDRGNGPPAAA